MYDQTPMNRLRESNGRHVARDHASDLDAAGARRLIGDIIELGELQARLFASDTKCLVESAIRPMILAASAALLVLGSLPVLLLSGADFLVQRFDWSPASAQFAVAGTSLVMAVVLGGLGLKSLKSCGSPLKRSAAEFEKNLDTLREMVSGESPLKSHLREMERHDREKANRS
jgi:hypothetical protein